jgi:hypothetical protein
MQIEIAILFFCLPVVHLNLSTGLLLASLRSSSQRQSIFDFFPARAGKNPKKIPAGLGFWVWGFEVVDSFL